MHRAISPESIIIVGGAWKLASMGWSMLAVRLPVWLAVSRDLGSTPCLLPYTTLIVLPLRYHMYM